MSIGKAFGAMAVVTLFSRISGFLRVAVFASYFGAGGTADIFLSVMILPELMYKFIADGLVSSSALPMLVREKPDREKSTQLFWTIFWGIALFSLPAILLLELFAEPICGAMVPGFVIESKSRMVILWRIIAPYVFFALEGALFTAYLNASGFFGLPSLGPLLVNVVIIIGIVLGYDKPVEWLGWAVILGIFVQFAWLLFLSFSAGLEWRRPFSPQGWNAIWLNEFVSLSAPVACWVFLTPFVPLFERYLLSSQPEGSVSILNYTDKIMFLPLGIISISLSAAVFPTLSRNSGKDGEKILETTLWGMAVFILPVALALFGGSSQVTEVIYRRGQFGSDEVALTVRLLRVFSLSLLPISASYLLNRLFFAMGNVKLPFFVGLFSITFQLLADSILVGSHGSIGVAWGAVLAGLLQMLLLFAGLFYVKGKEAAWNCSLPLFSALIILAIGVLPFSEFISIAARYFPPGKPGALLLLGSSWGAFQLIFLAIMRKRVVSLFY